MNIFGLKIGKQSINPSTYSREKDGFIFGGGLNGFNFQSISDENAINHGYRSNHDVYSIIDRIVRNTIDLPFELKKGEEVITEGFDYDLFWKQINPHQGFKKFWNEALIFYLATGDLYIWKRRESIGFEDISYYVMPSQLVTPEQVVTRNIYEMPRYYDFYNGETILRIPSNEVLHIKKTDIGTAAIQTKEGMSPLQAGKLLIDAANNLNTAEAAIFKNGGVSNLISGVSGTHSAGLTQTDKENIDEGFVSRIRGAWNFAKSIVIQSEAKVLKIGLTPQELAIFDSQLNHLRKLCNLYGVNSALFNDPENKTYNNAKEAEVAFFNDVVLPLGEIMISEFYDSEYSEFKVCINYEKVRQIQPDPTSLRKQLSEEARNGLIAVDEFRQHFELEPLGGEFSIPKVLRQNQQNGNQGNNQEQG